VPLTLVREHHGLLSRYPQGLKDALLNYILLPVNGYAVNHKRYTLAKTSSYDDFFSGHIKSKLDYARNV